VISLDASDFSDGSLRVASNIRPNRLFTADSRLVLYRVGAVTPAKMQEVVDAIVEIISN
jgi:mRNA interferase MazF